MSGQRSFFAPLVELAKVEERCHKIPYRIVLAQAYVLSDGGRLDVAKKGHNYFRIPCGEGSWPCIPSKDIPGSYCKYYTKAQAFRAHSLYLKKRFPAMIATCGDDEGAWVRALKRNGYAIVPGYEVRLNKALDILTTLNL